MNENSNRIEIPPYIFTVLGIIIGVTASILLELSLIPIFEEITCDAPAVFIIIIAILLIIVLVALEYYRHLQIRVCLSKRKASAFALIILLAIPIVWLSMSQRELLVSCLLVMMSVAVLLSTVVRAVLWKSLFIAVPAITLGVVVGSSGVIFAENIIDYGNPIAGANVVVVDHSLTVSDLGGNYPVKAADYVVIRDSNEVRVGISGMPMQKLYQVPVDLEITFNGQSILPDGKERYFTLERGKSYMLTLED
jgi:hypothetical protein